jgi:hypothetical protein
MLATTNEPFNEACGLGKAKSRPGERPQSSKLGKSSCGGSR